MIDLASSVNALLPAPGSRFYVLYASAWCSLCAWAIVLVAMRRHRLMPEARTYVRFLAVPWKLAVLAPALLFVTFAGRFTDDDTWDVGTGGGMAVLTYLTAPWAIGAAWQVLRRMRPRGDLVIAVALCLFSSSWFYDAYLTWRDGTYPLMWLPNLCASPLIYVAAGLLWNLEARPGGGGRLSFERPDWPVPARDRSVVGVALLALPPVLVAVVLLTMTVGWHR